MIIGIIGAGAIGATLAKQLVAIGHEVYVSNSRGPETLADVASATGATPATLAQTAERAELVIEAIPYGRYTVLPPDALADKIVILAGNYFPARDGEIDFQGRSQSEVVAAHLPRSKVVKAFNTIYWQHLRDQPNHNAGLSWRRVVPLAGDDPEARAEVAKLIEALGFGALDLGSLAAGGVQMEPGCPIFNEDLTLAAARKLVES